jgi:hypothetical protein
MGKGCPAAVSGGIRLTIVRYQLAPVHDVIGFP